MDETDLDAIARVRAGDRDAFRTLVDRYSRDVFRLAFRMMGNEADAEDVVQEAFLRSYRQLGHYESRCAFSTWLYRIAANYALDLLRVRKREAERRAIRDPEGLDLLEIAASNSPGQDRIYYSSQMRSRLKTAMDELSERERTAFVLRHFEGLSIEEIGSVMNIGAGATKNSIFRAVRKLRDALEPMMA